MSDQRTSKECDALIALKYDTCECTEKCEPCRGVRQKAIDEIERLQRERDDARADLAHREKHWAQFDHYPKGSTVEPRVIARCSEHGSAFEDRCDTCAEARKSDPVCTCPRDRPVTMGHAVECPRKLRAAVPPAVRPVAWWRRVTSYVPGEPIEYDEEFSGGDDQPDGDGWYPLYSRPAEPPVVEVHENDVLPLEFVLDKVKELIFSKRQEFFRYLEKKLLFGRDTRIAWPDGMLHLSREEFNDALRHAEQSTGLTKSEGL